jgi:hypothetical protein
LDKDAITIGGIDESQNILSINKVETIVFSDTIILYENPENMFTEGVIDPSRLILKACLLLRFAFERGVPLRGAISYGDYFIHDKVFLGTPIIEAYETQKIQDWSGAILCKSAEKEFRNRSTGCEVKRHQIFGITADPRELFNYLTISSIKKYKIQFKNFNSSFSREQCALCWDDSLLSLVGLQENLPKLNFEEKAEIYKRVWDMFRAHKKTVNPSIISKIKNTTDFIYSVANR